MTCEPVKPGFQDRRRSLGSVALSAVEEFIRVSEGGGFSLHAVINRPQIVDVALGLHKGAVNLADSAHDVKGFDWRVHHSGVLRRRFH